MLVPYFDPRGSGADREGYVQRGSNEEGSGTIIHRETVFAQRIRQSVSSRRTVNIEEK